MLLQDMGYYNYLELEKTTKLVLFRFHMQISTRLKDYFSCASPFSHMLLQLVDILRWTWRSFPAVGPSADGNTVECVS